MRHASEELVEQLRTTECYLERGHFKLVSGKHSESYLQARLALMDPPTRDMFARTVADHLSTQRVGALYATTIGGTLLARATSDMTGIPLLIGRPRAKQIELVNADEFEQSDLGHIVLIDDVLTTGGSVRSALEPLASLPGADVEGVLVAVDRSASPVVVVFGEKPLRPVGVARVPLIAWDPAECPACPRPYVNLSDPEANFISVVLSMPREWAPKILAGYRSVYEQQRDTGQLEELDRWEPWLPSLLEGLPVARIGEDSGLALFIRALGRPALVGKQNRVLTDLIGNLLALTHVRVENRSLGCCILVGDAAKALDQLHANVCVDVPRDRRLSGWGELVPYFDALLETDAVFVFTAEGELAGVKRLIRAGEINPTRGIQLLRDLTRYLSVTGLVVRRGRRAVSVYTQGSLTAIAELSEKTGLWEFTTPKPVVAQVEGMIPEVASTLELTLEIGREMVTYGYGGIFVISAGDEFPAHRPPKLQINPQPLAFLGTREVAEIAKLDGAVFITNDGEMVAASVIIENRGTAGTVKGSRSGGARRQAALRTSIEHPGCVVVCISQNGTIDIYVRGESMPVAEAISGLNQYAL